MSIRAIVGLGNPGKQYCTTRHNIGFIVIDGFVNMITPTGHTPRNWSHDKKLDSEHILLKYTGKELHLLKPQTYMNLSGKSVSQLMRYYKIKLDEICVIVDDINLELGRAKLSIKGSSGGHNGLEDLFNRVGDKFMRYRIGVGGKRHPNMDLKDHVLSTFTDDEINCFNQRMSHYVNDLKCIVRANVQQAMNQINQRNRNYDTSVNSK